MCTKYCWYTVISCIYHVSTKYIYAYLCTITAWEIIMHGEGINK